MRFSLLVNMGLTLSSVRIPFYRYHVIARNKNVPSFEIRLMKFGKFIGGDYSYFHVLRNNKD